MICRKKGILSEYTKRAKEKEQVNQREITGREVEKLKQEDEESPIFTVSMTKSKQGSSVIIKPCRYIEFNNGASLSTISKKMWEYKLEEIRYYEKHTLEKN